MKLFAQIAAVTGALSMLVGFVVYSQEKAGRPVDHLKTGSALTSTNVATKPAHAVAL